MPHTTTITGSTLCLAIALAQSAHAQDRPKLLPTRDVAVTYQLAGGPGGGQTTHLFYSATLGKLRIDTPNGAGYTVLNQAASNQTLVMTQQHAYATMPLPPGAANGFILNDTMNYRREGQRTIAGIPCTEWAVSSQQATGDACVTNDGVLLSGTGHQVGGEGQQSSLVATNVQYAPQPASLFQPPSGFQQMSQQQVQQMMGQPPGQ